MAVREKKKLENVDVDEAGKVLVSGALARVVACSVLFPLDTVKARLQFQRDGKMASVKRVYSGATDVAKWIIKEEGFFALWRGLGVRLLYVTPSAAVSFTLYEQFKRMFRNFSIIREEKKEIELSRTNKTNPKEQQQPKNNPKGHQFLFQKEKEEEEEDGEWRNKRARYEPLVWLAAGAGARTFGTALRTPFDVVKERLQVQGALKAPPYRSTFHVFHQVLAVEGIRGLFNGYICTMMRDVPFSALYFTSYESSKYVVRHKLQTEPGTATHLVGGAFAGAFAAICTLPMDVVKLKMQTQNALPPEDRLYRNLRHCWKTIFQEEGMRGFYRGWRPILLKVVPSSSLTFCCYEFFKRLIFSQNTQTSK